MRTNTKDKIIEYIAIHGQARVKELSESLNIYKTAIHRHLNQLVDSGQIVRVGKPPLVFYRLSTNTLEQAVSFNTSVKIKRIIEDNFLSITPDGKLLYGVEGLVYWAKQYQKGKPIETVAEEYAATIESSKEIFSVDGYADATSKLTENFNDSLINKMLLEDIYSYKIYGRTKLAKMVMYAKQVGDKPLIDQISDNARPIIEKIIRRYKIEAVVFIPPTVPRPLQFMDELKKRLSFSIPEIDLAKVVPGDIPIPQKTLSNLEDRVINARDSIFLKTNTQFPFNNVLLIDDVVGSGASFHETAVKLKNSKIGLNSIIAFALVGNIKGYEVIREI